MVRRRPGPLGTGPGSAHDSKAPNRPTFRTAAPRFEVDGQLYVLLPERTDGWKRPDDHARHRANLERTKAGELLTAKGRYLIVPVDGARKESRASSAPTRRLQGLTRRELQIVVLVAEGCVNKQIADRLKISEWTVSTHLRRIFAKLCVDSRAAMVYRCSGLIGERDVG